MTAPNLHRLPRSVYAYEIVPEPDDAAPLIEHARYNVARAQGFWLGFVDNYPGNDAALLIAATQARHALLLVALHNGLDAEAALKWAHDRTHDGDAGEWIWQSARALGIDVQAIRAYKVARTGDES